MTTQFPELDKAAGVMDNMYSEVYFGKLAQHGFVPKTAADIESMLETGLLLDSLPEDTQQKQAADSPYADAHTRLVNVLGQHGAIPPAVKEAESRQMALAVASDPEVYSSVLSIKAAQAAAGAEETTDGESGEQSYNTDS
jgi:hypothetical protein